MSALRALCRVAALATLASAVPATSVFAQDTEWNRYTLEELAGVFVSATVQSACSSAGVTEDGALTRANAALEEGEVPLLSEQEMLSAPGLPELLVSVHCASDDGAVGFTVSVRLQQAAQMIRDSQITLSEAVTWWTTTAGVASSGDAATAIGDTVAETARRFATAFSAANAAETETR